MTKSIPAREAYGQALLEIGKQKTDFVVLEADLSASTRTVYFGEAFPDRYFDCGIAEMNMMGMAAGLAASGITPVANTFSVFSSMKSCEQVRTFICYPNLNVKIVSTHAGMDVGEAGVTHQAIEDVAIMRSFPNMKVISPADGVETASALSYMLNYEGPIYLRLGRSDLPQVHPDDYQFELGIATTLREGKDITLIGTGITVGFALQAAELLEKNKISARVINMSSLKPVDQGVLLRAARETQILFTVEDHSIIGGLGSAVLEALAETKHVPVVRLGLQDVFGESGKPEDLFAKYGLDGEGIKKAVENKLSAQ